jgi:hypothetical protein
MIVDGHCHSCGFNFDAHWSKMGTCVALAMTCPRCLIKGRCSTQTDEVNDFDNYSDSGDDDVDTIDE